PSIVDAALQATIGLTHGSAGSAASGLALPFALDELEVYGACTVTMWAFIRGSADAKAGGGVRKLDIDVCNETGAVRVRMQGFSFRVLAPVLSPPAGEVLLAERGFSSFSPREKVGGEGLQHLVQASHPLPGGEGKEGADALMLEPYWQERDISEEAAAPVYAHHLTILCELGPEWDSPQNSAGGEPTTAVGSSTDSRRYLSLH